MNEPSTSDDLVLRALWRATSPRVPQRQGLAARVLSHLDKVPAGAWRLRA